MLRPTDAYIIGRLLILVALLVRSSLGFVWLALLVVQRLPAFTEDLSDLACKTQRMSVNDLRDLISDVDERTKGDSGILISNILTLVVGEEHVGREGTFGRVGILVKLVSNASTGQIWRHYSPFFFFSTPRALVLRVVVFSLGMVEALADLADLGGADGLALVAFVVRAMIAR